VTSVGVVEETWSFVAGNGEGSGGWNVGQSDCEDDGECFQEEQGGGFDIGVARCQQWCRVVGVVWNGNMVLMTMRMWRRKQEGADRRSLVAVELIRNCRSSSACSVDVRTGISCGGGCAKVLWLV
jgi:hypothetical protein